MVACKYRAWEHHTALDALALWFIAETKLDWARQYHRSPELVHEMEVAVLPGLSMSNLREMLKSVMPLKQLSPEEASGQASCESLSFYQLPTEGTGIYPTT